MKLLYLITQDWFFKAYAEPMAKIAKENGFEVIIATHLDQHRDRFEKMGFKTIHLNWSRGSLNPFLLIKTLVSVYKIYRSERPDFVQHISMQTILMGGIINKILKFQSPIYVFTGLGSFFAGNNFKFKMLRFILLPVLKWILSEQNMRIIVENQDDQEFLISKIKVNPSQIHLLKSLGIDTQHYQPLPFPPLPIHFGYVGRMLKFKGPLLLVRAVQTLNKKGHNFHLVLAGGIDPQNHFSFTKQEIESWTKDPHITWLGHCKDIRDVWKKCHVGVALSSKGEGLPKSLLEAASCGRPIITTYSPDVEKLLKIKKMDIS